MLKKIGLVLVVILVVILATPAFLPKKAEVTREIDFGVPASKVYAVVSDLNQFPKWNPFAEMEPDVKFEIQGQGVGSTYSWKGDKTGSGKMTIAELNTDSAVMINMDFFEPFPGVAKSSWKLVSTSDQSSKMVWGFEQDLGYLQRFFGLTMDAMMGPTFEKGLTNLKTVVEK